MPEREPWIPRPPPQKMYPSGAEPDDDGYLHLDQLSAIKVNFVRQSLWSPHDAIDNTTSERRVPCQGRASWDNRVRQWRRSTSYYYYDGRRQNGQDNLLGGLWLGNPPWQENCPNQERSLNEAVCTVMKFIYGFERDGRRRLSQSGEGHGEELQIHQGLKQIIQGPLWNLEPYPSPTRREMGQRGDTGSLRRRNTEGDQLQRQE